MKLHFEPNLDYQRAAIPVQHGFDDNRIRSLYDIMMAWSLSR